MVNSRHDIVNQRVLSTEMLFVGNIESNRANNTFKNEDEVKLKLKNWVNDHINLIRYIHTFFK